MILFNKSLSTWGTPQFNSALKAELEQLDADSLPLQQGLTHGSYSNENNISVMVLSAHEESDAIHARVGIFYTSIIAGCSCADDPTPVEEQNEYCEASVVIRKSDAGTVISYAG